MLPALTVLLCNLLYLAVVVVLNDGSFAYALDDAYIHLAISGQFASHGILSLDGVHFASASSSPLWMVVLAPFTLLPDAVAVYIPFLLNVLFQSFAVLLCVHIAKACFSYELKPVHALFLVFLTPLLPLSIGGMEHSLQIFVMLLLLYAVLRYDKRPETKQALLLAGAAALFVSVRYEGLALTGLVVLWLIFIRRSYAHGLIVLFGSAAPVVLYGIWSLSMGLPFVPSSILAKTVMKPAGNDASFVSEMLSKSMKLFKANHLLILFASNTYIFLKSRKEGSPVVILSGLLLLSMVAQVTLGSLGWLYRYEAYLMFWGLLNIFLYFRPVRWSRGVAVAAAVLLFFMGSRVEGAVKAAKGTRNILHQQVQMGQFLGKYHKDASVAANDIGAVTFFTDIQLLDLWGLGSMEVLQLRRQGRFNIQTVAELLRKYKTDIIVIYPESFAEISMESAGYVPVGSWQIQDNVVCAGDEVIFYARNEIADTVRQTFLRYSEEDLPEDVSYSIK